jgi:predicted DNA-binding transcriptional regulator YafY
MSDPLALSKAQRLAKLSHWLYRHPHGLTAAEIARLLGVSTRTAQRDLHDLEDLGVPLWDDAGDPPRYGVLEGFYLPPVHLSLDDALALYLAARLLARYADAYDPHITAALGKLATVLPEPLARHIHTTIRDLAAHTEDRAFVTVLGTLALGWATGRKVRIHHLAATSDEETERVLYPYFLEPSATGNATYVMGWVEDLGEMRTFKVERIQSARLLEETFQVPEAFDGPALLRSAWGIMYGEDTQTVHLRFAPSAVRRLHETVWHPSQRLEGREDGGCDLWVEVAHPEEMAYWIRGWGPQVEVLAPAWLRERMAQEAREMARMYGGGR